MTTTGSRRAALDGIRRLPRRGGSDPVEPGLLLRVPITEAMWAESLPPVPAGADVTVAFSDDELHAEHADAVAMLGYRVVGVADLGTDVDTADLLIPRSACDRWPVWRDALLDSGGRVFDLSFGPTAAVLGAAISVHDTGEG